MKGKVTGFSPSTRPEQPTRQMEIIIQRMGASSFSSWRNTQHMSTHDTARKRCRANGTKSGQTRPEKASSNWERPIQGGKEDILSLSKNLKKAGNI